MPEPVQPTAGGKLRRKRKKQEKVSLKARIEKFEVPRHWDWARFQVVGTLAGF